MSDNIQFISLVQQAASAVNMAGAGDSSDLEALQSLFNQISDELKDIGELPEDVQGQAVEASDSASQLVDILLKKEIENTHRSLNSLSETVVALQEMADKMLTTSEASELRIDFPEIDIEKLKNSDDKQGVADVEDKPDEVETQPSQAQVQDSSEGMIIPEEDAPMVLDFITEACEHIEAAEAGLLELESTPDDTEAINTIFRGFHTIKGMAGFLNLTEIGSLAHAAENLLDLARQSKLQLVGSNMDVIFESIDLMKKMTADLQSAIEGGIGVLSQPELKQVLERIKICAEGNPADTAAPAAAPAEKTKPVEEAPAPESPAVQKQGITEAESQDQQKSDDSVKDQETSPEAEKPEKEAVEPAAGQKTEVAKSVEIAETQAAQQATAKVKQIPDEKIKVSTNRLDELVNMAGELVIAQSMVTQQAMRELGDDHQLCTKISHQGKIVRELQELSMLMRMVPIQGVFGKMARLVRDLSRKSGKQINFVTQGEDTELDRNVVDQISDPLVHMVRNSIDHGIEATAEDRQAAGKDAAGKVQLRAFHQAGNIIIEIEDDGRGLDKEKILGKAIKNGVVEPGQELSDSDIYKLIFHAGLSTAEEITSISGRGVGMDVVKKNIEALRGKIEISSENGKGTVFTIRLPLTLAIIDGQVIRIGNQKYIIPILSIERCLRPSREQITSVQNRGEMAHVQGELLPVVRLYRQFGVEPDTEDITESSLVVVEEDGRKGALMVDELLDQQQTVIKSLGESFGEIKGISGGAIMGDGRVSLILDVPGLLELASN